MVELKFKLTVNTAAIGIAAFMKTESRKKTDGGCEVHFLGLNPVRINN